MMNFGEDLEQDITLHIQLIGQRLLAWPGSNHIETIADIWRIIKTIHQ